MEREVLDAASTNLAEAVGEMREELVRLRKTVLKLGHAQELFQGRIEETVDRLARRPEEGAGGLTAVQVRVMIELDQAVLHLLSAIPPGGALQAADAGTGDTPGSVREGLALLQIRIRNLQRSFGLEPIPTLRQPFDDRLHEAHGICRRPGLDDGIVAEEVLPGYRLRGRVVRPARVIVNRNHEVQT
jgi:molecular chaperone GrpE